MELPDRNSGSKSAGKIISEKAQPTAKPVRQVVSGCSYRGVFGVILKYILFIKFLDELLNIDEKFNKFML